MDGKILGVPLIIILVVLAIALLVDVPMVALNSVTAKKQELTDRKVDALLINAINQVTPTATPEAKVKAIPTATPTPKAVIKRLMPVVSPTVAQ